MICTCVSTVVGTFDPCTVSWSGGRVGSAGCCCWISRCVKSAGCEIVAAGDHRDDEFACLCGRESASGRSRTGYG